jgi:hypothetical protein
MSEPNLAQIYIGKKAAQAYLLGFGVFFAMIAILLIFTGLSKCNTCFVQHQGWYIAGIVFGFLAFVGLGLRSTVYSISSEEILAATKNDSQRYRNSEYY